MTATRSFDKRPTPACSIHLWGTRCWSCLLISIPCRNITPDA